MQFADVPVSLSQCEGTVLGGFHQLTLTGAFVVEAAEVEDAVDDDAVQFLVVRLAELLGVGAHGVERDDEVAADGVAFAIVEGDDVGVVVVP